MKPMLLPANKKEFSSVKFQAILKSQKLLVWCTSIKNNSINIVDKEIKKKYANFQGATSHNTISNSHFLCALTYSLNLTASGACNQVKEIPNTQLLCSLHHNINSSANLNVFDIPLKLLYILVKAFVLSENDKVRKFYSSSLMDCLTHLINKL